MKGKTRPITLAVLVILFVLSLALVGCGSPDATVAKVIPAEAQEQATQAPPTAPPPTVAPTKTPIVPTPTSQPTVEPTPEPLPEEQDEPGAGAWQTWVLESGSQLPVDAPPDEAATAAEIEQLVAMAGERDEADMLQIAYWDAGPPAYRWNQIAVSALNKRGVPAPMGLRHLALFHAAIYDATVAAWDAKYTYNRPRPTEVEPGLSAAVPNPASPSYPSEYAVTAGAASAVLAWLFPEEAAAFEEQAQQAVESRLLAGVEYPSDVEAGLELGRQVAELVIARGMADGSADPWRAACPPSPAIGQARTPPCPQWARGRRGCWRRAISSAPRPPLPTIRKNWRPRWKSCALTSARHSATRRSCSGNMARAAGATTGSGARSLTGWCWRVN